MKTTHWMASLLVALALVLWTGTAPVRAEDGEEEERVEPLSTRLYAVGALTRGRFPFPSQFRPMQRPGESHRESREVGVDLTEPRYPLGVSDELIELIKCHVLPAFWEMTEGADIAALGASGLVVRAAPAVHAELGRYLARLERTHLRTVSVDVQAIRLSAEGLTALVGTGRSDRLEDAAVAAVLSNEGVGPAARITTENGMQAESFGGEQRAFLRRTNVVAHEGKALSLPVAGVSNPGLAVAVEPMIHHEGRSVRLRLDATLTQGLGRKSVKTASGETIELPSTPGLDVHADLVLTPGTWALAHGAGDGWSLLVRAIPSGATGFGRRAQAIVLDAPFDARPGTMVIRDFDVTSLARSLKDVIGEGAFLYDTSWDGPPALDMTEPEPPMAGEYLVELLMRSIGSQATWEDPATIEYRSGTLIMRQTKPVLAAVEAWLDRLRRAVPAAFTTVAELVAVSPALASRLTDPAHGGADAWLVDGEERALLTAALADGTAQRRATARMSHMDGVRNTARDGSTLRYVSTYDAVRSNGALVVRPQMAQCLKGFELDLRASGTPGGSSALLALRIMRTWRRGPAPLRVVKSIHGPIELPALATTRLRTNCSVPLGRTAVAGVVSDGANRVVLLVTVRAQPREP